MITSENLPIHEMIDLVVVVVRSTDPTMVGLQGRISDETKNTFTVERPDGKQVMVQKVSNGFEFRVAGGRLVRLDGSAIAYRPQDRIKKLGIKGNRKSGLGGSNE